jgi:hypothetical protein
MNFFKTCSLAKRYLIVSAVIATVFILPAWKNFDIPSTITWEINNTNRIGNYQPLIWGNPLIKSDTIGQQLYFNGINDGLEIPGIPIQGWHHFTIEVLFKPCDGGPPAPRFIHFEDSDFNRGTFEVRLKSDGYWYMDTFLKNGKENRGLTLIDSSLLHPSNQWYWVALVYEW